MQNFQNTRIYAKNLQKGSKYEELVAKFYRDEGYIVFKNSLLGQQDGGLDLIAFHENHTLLIQCKNYAKDTKYKLKKEDLETIIKNLDEFKKNHLFYPHKDYEVKFILAISSACVEKETFMTYLKSKKIEIILLPISDNGEFIISEKKEKKGNLFKLILSSFNQTKEKSLNVLSGLNEQERYNLLSELYVKLNEKERKEFEKIMDYITLN